MMMPDQDQAGHAEVVPLQADEPARERDGFNTRRLPDVRRGPDGAPRRRVLTGAATAIGKGTARHGWTIAAGVASWIRRAVFAATHGPVREQIRAARSSGDTQALAEWTERLAAQRQKRRDTLVALPKMVYGAAVALASVLTVLTVLAVVVGTAAEIRDGGMDWAGWWGLLGAVAGGAGSLLVLALYVVALAGPLVLLAAAWREGVRAADVPAWLAAPGERDDEGAVVTADAIVTALRHLAVPAMNKAFKDGWQPRFLTTPVRDGHGFHAVVELPLGVTPGMVADKRAVLARNLHRAEVEVWPAESDQQAGYLDLWVANSGVLGKPAPDYPLLHDGVADVFTGVPIGVTQRGDELALPLVEANVVVGGMPGQGKSNFGRVLMLGAALDPLAELRAYVFAGNADFDSYAPRLAAYRKGADEDTITAGVDSLRELYDEIARREHRLSELGAKKLTRGLAEQHADLRPLVAFYSECHEMFGHTEHGKDAAGYAAAVVRRGRKTGVICGFDTQSSRADAIPPKVVELVKLNACFAVKTWRSNDGFLGDGSFASGVRATELRPGKDRGTCLLTGATGERFELLKTYYIEADDESGWDAATDVIARAMSAGVTARTGRDEPEQRDLLADVDQVLGDEPVPAADVPALLRELAPTWPAYRRMTGRSLRGALSDLGVKVPSTGNRYPIDPATIRAALAEADQ